MLHLASTVHSNRKLGCEVSWQIGAVSAKINVLQEVLAEFFFGSQLEAETLRRVCDQRLKIWSSASVVVRGRPERTGWIRCQLFEEASFVSRVSNDRMRQLARQKLFAFSEDVPVEMAWPRLE